MRRPKRRLSTRRARSAPKSSPEARRLIRAALRRHKTQARAARALGLPSQAQLSRMLSGDLADTPEMKAALKRADARAARAWGFVVDDYSRPVDLVPVLDMVQRLERDLAVLKALVMQ
jgi:hypothetical protein